MIKHKELMTAEAQFRKQIEEDAANMISTALFFAIDPKLFKLFTEMMADKYEELCKGDNKFPAIDIKVPDIGRIRKLMKEVE